MMSDVLKGQIPTIEDELVEQKVETSVIVIAQRVMGAKNEPLVAILKGVLFGVEPEVELRVCLDDAFNVIQATDMTLASLELHHGERIISMPGPFIIKQARIDEISDQMCTLGLHLKRQVR